MKTINQDEFYQNLSGFLKSKGVELQDGAYTQRIRTGCDLLTDAINATQKTVKRAKTEVDRKLEQLRQSIHEATAPQPPPPPSERRGGNKPASARRTANRRAKSR